jgi:molybdopterin-containing oxidoreductase family membrane subunit
MHAPVRYEYQEGFTVRSWGVLIFFAAIVGLAGLSALYMETYGHWVTGMTQRIPWGMPHVFAFFLIISASGALNIASIGSVFRQTEYQPLGRLSVLLAFSLLAGGLFVLVTDLGRVDRLIITLIYSNFNSVFAWNVFIYQGFFALVVIYLWVMMSPKMQPFYRPAAIAAFIWRLGMTTGTGSVLGFLVSRAAFRSAIMAPEFIALSLSLGLAIFVLMMLAFARWEGRPIPTPSLLRRMRGLLALLIAVALYMVAVQHLTGIYMAERRAVERFILLDGGIYTLCLWGGFVLLGSIVPLVLLLTPATARFPAVLPCACGLVVLGGLTLLYSLLIGGEAFPLELFPGKVVSSSAFDGVVAIYSPSLPEFFLGLGGMGVAGLVVTMGTWVLPLLPDRAGAETPEGVSETHGVGVSETQHGAGDAAVPGFGSEEAAPV